MLNRIDVDKVIPLSYIDKVKTIIDGIDTDDFKLVTKYNLLRCYDEKIRRSESEVALEAFNMVDDILTNKYSFDTEVNEWRYEITLRIVLSLMIYGAINIELDSITREEFIELRTELRSWYKKLKKVVK